MNLVREWHASYALRIFAAWCGLVTGAATASGAGSAASDGATESASWAIPAADEIRSRLGRFLEHATADASLRAKAGDAFAADPAADRLDRMIAALAILDPRVAKIEAVKPPQVFEPADLAWLADEPTTPSDDVFVREAVCLHVARHLVRCGLFDDAMPILARLDPDGSVDPATLLFCRAICQHWLLDADGAAETLDRLLERRDELPVRYERLASLMRKDLDSLEDDSLDHIARRMKDVTRRLSFGRAGPATRSVQDGVIASLDKLIEKIERQQQECQSQGGGAAGGGGAGGGQGSNPMQDSMPAGGKGPGEVTKKDIGDGEGWGNLPPHEREEALQQISREFPTHYREAIEQYFKRLAAGDRTVSPGGSSAGVVPQRRATAP